MASQITSIDFSVDAVAVAVTEDGVFKVTAGDSTDTAATELVVVLLPSAPYVFNPQHFTVVSLRTAHEWTFPGETCKTPVTLGTAVGVRMFVPEPPACPTPL